MSTTSTITLPYSSTWITSSCQREICQFSESWVLPYKCATWRSSGICFSVMMYAVVQAHSVTRSPVPMKCRLSVPRRLVTKRTYVLMRLKVNGCSWGKPSTQGERLPFLQWLSACIQTSKPPPVPQRGCAKEREIVTRRLESLAAGHVASFILPQLTCPAIR